MAGSTGFRTNMGWSPLWSGRLNFTPVFTHPTGHCVGIQVRDIHYPDGCSAFRADRSAHSLLQNLLCDDDLPTSEGRGGFTMTYTFAISAAFSFEQTREQKLPPTQTVYKASKPLAQRRPICAVLWLSGAVPCSSGWCKNNARIAWKPRFVAARQIPSTACFGLLLSDGLPVNGRQGKSSFHGVIAYMFLRHHSMSTCLPTFLRCISLHNSASRLVPAPPCRPTHSAADCSPGTICDSWLVHVRISYSWPACWEKESVGDKHPCKAASSFKYCRQGFRLQLHTIHQLSMPEAMW